MATAHVLSYHESWPETSPYAWSTNPHSTRTTGLGEVVDHWSTASLVQAQLLLIAQRWVELSNRTNVSLASFCSSLLLPIKAEIGITNSRLLFCLFVSKPVNPIFKYFFSVLSSVYMYGGTQGNKFLLAEALGPREPRVATALLTTCANAATNGHIFPKLFTES